MTISPAGTDLRLMWEQTNEVARGTLRESPMMPVSAIALGAVGAFYSSIALGTLWAAAMLVSSGVLIAACRRFCARGFTPSGARAGIRTVYLASLLHACVTGSHLLVFWTPGHDATNMVLLIIFMASAMFAVSLTAMSLRMLITNIVLHAVVAETVLILEGGDAFTVLAMLAPLYFAALTASGLRTYQRAKEVLVLARERDNMIAELTRADEAKSVFLANMSHELRTPLNAIIGFSEVMKDEMMGPMASPTYKGYASDIHVSGQHLLGLVNDILDLAKIESGSLELADDRFTMNAIVDAAFDLFGLQASRKGVALVKDVAEDVAVRWDLRAAKQIAINLMSNALKFTPAGGTVTVISRRRDDGWAYVTVKDTGVGIAPDEHATIFESFGQARHDLAIQEKGTGLGLAIVRGLVELHGGRLSVESDIGKGAAFTIHVPPERVIDVTAMKAAA